MHSEAHCQRGSVTISPATDRVDYAGCWIGSSLNIFGKVVPGVSHANGGGELTNINEDGLEQSSNYWERERKRRGEWEKERAKEYEKEYVEREADQKRR